MDLAASLALFAKGRDEWNAWAAAAIERGRAIVAAGEWGWAFDSRSDPYPTNQTTANYWHDAAAVFSYHTFAEPPDFSGFVFPGYAGFITSKFPRGATFRQTRFGDGVGFNFARFDGAVTFDDAEFRSRGAFYRAEFFGEVSLRDTRFVRGEFEPSMQGQADFSEAKFRMPVSFAGMRCNGNGLFGNTDFAQAVDFAGACFGNMFFIFSAAFHSSILVRGARFPHPVDWSKAKLAVPPTA
jgi:hypothetical protein